MSPPKRDAVLAAVAERYVTEHRHEQKVVGVLFGAAHAGPFVHFLSRRFGYIVRSAEWLTVSEP